MSLQNQIENVRRKAERYVCNNNISNINNNNNADVYSYVKINSYKITINENLQSSVYESYACLGVRACV